MMKKKILLGLVFGAFSIGQANELIIASAMIEANDYCQHKGKNAYYNDRGHWKYIDKRAYIEALNHYIYTAELNLLMSGTPLDKPELMRELKILGPQQFKSMQKKNMIKCQ